MSAAGGADKVVVTFFLADVRTVQGLNGVLVQKRCGERRPCQKYGLRRISVEDGNPDLHGLE